MECRTCLKITDEFQDLFSEGCNLLHKIETILSIQILTNEHFPTKICNSCVTNVEILYDFCDVVRRSNMILENRACGVQNDETSDCGNHSESVEDDLIQIDEIKVEYGTEDLDFDDPVETNDDDLSSPSTISKTNRERKALTNKIYNCTECDFTTQHYKLIRNHRNRHKNKRAPRSICNICGKSVTTYNLNKHLANHTDSPKACEVCGKVLKHSDTLRRHMYVHKVVILQCTYCKKIYRNRQSYYRHLQQHKNGDAKKLQCHMCEKLFNDKKALQKHIRSHTGERPYPCEYCKKGFSSPHALKTHIRQHTKEKPFGCNFCDMAFPQRVSLRTHLKSKHPDKTLEQVS